MRACGQLEYSLIELTQTLYLSEKPACHRVTDKKLREITSSIGKMATFLESQFKTYLIERPELQELALKLSEIIKDISQLRNALCHGLWTKEGANTLLCQFWSKNALEEGGKAGQLMARPEEYRFDQTQLREVVTYMARVSNELVETNASFQRVQATIGIR